MNMTDKPNRADLEKVIDKVRKLLALGTSPNEHEAASAVSKAQALLEAYDLTMESVEDLKSDKRTSIGKGDFFGQSLETRGKTDGWKKDLFSAVAYSFDCFTDERSETDPTHPSRCRRVGRFIGFAHDVDMAGYSLSFLIHEIERLAQDYADTLWAEIRAFRDERGISQHDAESEYVRLHDRHPLKAKIYFTKGAAESVADNLRTGYYKRQREAVSANPNAIMLRKREAVEDFLYMEQYGRTKKQQAEFWEIERKKWAEKYGSITPAPTPTETPAQARARRERQDREWRKQCERAERRRAREEAETDHRAYQAGSVAGSSISINPGLNRGQKQKDLE